MAQVSFYKINNNQLNSVEIEEGQVIFVQDTGELYIDKDSSHRIQVSNGNAIRNLIDDVATGSIKGVGTNGSFGQYSFSEGSGTVAHGNNSHAEGKDTAAIDDYSHVEGQGSCDITTITGNANATTYFYDNTSVQIEEGAFVILPNLGIAQKVYSADIENATFDVSETLSSVALSNEDCFVYYGGVADGVGAHSEGYYTRALANGAHSEGWRTIASWEYSHAEGNSTAADYLGAHAEGGYTQANGMYSHAEGMHTVTNGDYSHAEGQYTIANGMYSHAEGDGTIAYEENSHAEGSGQFYSQYTISGTANATTYTYTDYSLHPESHEIKVGNIVSYGGILAQIVLVDASNSTFTVNKTLSYSEALTDVDVFIYLDGFATGSSAHSEGSSTIASGNSSHAEGYYTQAIGNNSHAEGAHSMALGVKSHAEGLTTMAKGDYSHAEGTTVVSYGTGSHAEGYCLVYHEKYSFSGAANATTYTISFDAEDVDFPEVGDIIINNKIIAAVTAVDWTNMTVTVDKTLSDTALDYQQLDVIQSGLAYGNYSHVEGMNNKAYGDASHAEGNQNDALGDYSHAEGLGNWATGYGAHAEGYGNYAEGEFSHAEGYSTRARGTASHAEGEAYAEGYGSHAEGQYSHAWGNFSHVEGIRGYASGEGSHVEGYQSSADTIYLSGSAGTTTYNYSVNNNVSVSVGQIIEGSYGTAIITSLSNDTLTVNKTINPGMTLSNASASLVKAGAAGMYSHAEGENTFAYGQTSHAEGYRTIAQKKYQHVQGKYNIADPGDTNDATMSRYAHIIGNGTANNARSNAHTIDWAGNAWFAGDIKIGGTSYDNATTVIAGPASSTTLGGLKVRYDATTQTLYIRNDGSDA